MSELPRHGRSTIRTVLVMARVVGPKNKLVAMTAAGPPGAHRVIFDLPEFGGLRARGDDSLARAKLAKVSFTGATYVKFALLRSIMCVSEEHTTVERFKFFANSVMNSTTGTILAGMADEQMLYRQQLEAASTDTNVPAEERELYLKKLRPCKEMTSAIEEVQINTGKYFQCLIDSPNQFDVLDVLGSTINFMERNDSGAAVRKTRGDVASSFCIGSGLMYMGRLQTDVYGSLQRVTTTVTVATKFLTTPNPHPGLTHNTLHRAPVGQELLLPRPARAFGFWSLRAFANGSGRAGHV